MNAQLKLGRIAGVEIGANWSWVVVVGLIVWSLGAAVFPTENPGLSDGVYVAMAVVAALLFFASLLAHELGHAVVARREGMEIEGIVLWIFGGVARFNGLFPSAGAELRIALAGPAVSLAIGLALTATAQLAPLPSAVDGVVSWLGRINLVLLVFNMLPALPLDGGRVLRALLWRSSGDFIRATRVAAGLGRGFGYALVGSGIALLVLAASPSGLWLALIALFLIGAADAEGRLATIQQALAALTVADAMAAYPDVVKPSLSVDEFASRVFPRARHAAYPVVDGSRVIGLLAFRDAASIPPPLRATTHVRDVACSRDEVSTFSPTDDLGTAAIELIQSPVGRALVLDGERLVGLLSMTDVSRLIELHGREGGPPSASKDRASRRASAIA